VEERPDLLLLVTGRLRDQLGMQDEVSEESDLLNDLGLDSVGLAMLLLEVAEELDLDLASLVPTLVGIETVRDVVALLQTLLAATDASC
jgi:acyl carrier protein